jgi:hypothetical protein
VGICGCEEVQDQKTGNKKPVLRFHRAIIDDDLHAVVYLQREVRASLWSALEAQKSFKPFFTETVEKKMQRAQILSGKYQISLDLQYRAEVAKDKLAHSAKVLGALLHECILYGHRAMQVQERCARGSISLKMLEELPQAKRQKF